MHARRRRNFERLDPGRESWVWRKRQKSGGNKSEKIPAAHHNNNSLRSLIASRDPPTTASAPQHRGTMSR
jgi:hypothetical protein